ncbi:DUF2157 domain-containing protein [Diaphorobacter ruginosibacter]|uniref:DUF2157 domain-containing protein n=1 Tax=Diaphorobacter ruginosibacter TaxID=1715720 RepID=UPI0033403D8D
MDRTLYEWAARQPQGSDARIAQLHAVATAPGDARALARNMHRGLLFVAGVLLASGLIFWIAANWQEQTRMFKLCLIEGALLVSVLASIFWRRGRIAALLCATLALGGLLAFVGQTYQTGADAWQLFAAWAGLALIWALPARSDVLWTVWIAVAAAAIGMWWGRFNAWEMLFSGGRAATQQLLFIGMWLLLALVPTLVSLAAWTRHRQGVAWWSHRLALALALCAWTTLGVSGLFSRTDSPLAFALCGLLIAATLALSYKGRLQDFASLCLGALAANAWIMALTVRAIPSGSGDVGAFLICTVVGIGCLAATVSGLLAVQRGLRARADGVSAGGMQ